MGIKVGSYSKEDAALRASTEFAKTKAELMAERSRLAREYSRKGIGRAELDEGMAAITRKLQRAAEKAQRAMP